VPGRFGLIAKNVAFNRPFIIEDLVLILSILNTQEEEEEGEEES
jgi:hypothetical protein